MRGALTIIKNTGFLYFRMIVMLIIAFFTSRVLLKELGIENYGLYTIIAGVVAMFSSLRGAFTSSIQRFLNYEKGRGNFKHLQEIFSMGVNVHFIICVIFLLVTETLGLWFLNHKLVVPQDRLLAANWVYQFSIAASLIVIMTIPQDAVIIANQRMNIYVYITLLEAILKLLVVFIIPLVKIDALILYSILILCTSLIIRIITYLYCRKHFSECRYFFYWNKPLFKKLGTFAGWNFLGNMTFSIINEGGNIILNFFGGTVANAARGITYQVRSAIEMFVNNIQIATSPHITETYAKKKYESFFALFYSISKISFFITSVLCLPIIVNTSYLLHLWLKEVPEYTESFIRLTMYMLLIRVFHGPIDSILKAEGNIRLYQIIESATLFLSLPMSFILLKSGFPLQYVFFSMIIFETFNWIFILLIAAKTVHLNIIIYLKKVLLPSVLVLVINFSFFYLVKSKFFFTTIFENLLAICLISALSCITIWIIGLTQNEKNIIKAFLFSKLKRNNED